MTELQKIQSSDGESYPVGGYDRVLSALQTWRLDATEGVVGIPVDRDIATMLVDAGYETSRAQDVATTALACHVLRDIDKKF